jgi:hypothetical protein
MTLIHLLYGTRLSSGLALGVVTFWFMAAATGADGIPAPPRVITADQARKHIDERVTVIFKVQHTKFASKMDRVYLDSEDDFRDAKNLGVLIEGDALAVFTKAGIKEPHQHYEGKTIRITGKPFERDDGVFIKADRPDQIEIITPAKTKPH